MVVSWASGERVSYTAWNRGEPNNWAGNEACTHIMDFNRWNDLACHHALFGIIEIDHSSTSRPPLPLLLRLANASH